MSDNFSIESQDAAISHLVTAFDEKLKVVNKRDVAEPLTLEDIDILLKFIKNFKSGTEIALAARRLRKVDLLHILTTAFSLKAAELKKLNKLQLTQICYRKSLVAALPSLSGIDISSFGHTFLKTRAGIVPTSSPSTDTTEVCASGSAPAETENIPALAGSSSPPGNVSADELPEDNISEEDIDPIDVDDIENVEDARDLLFQLQRAKILERTSAHPRPEVIFSFRKEEHPEANSYNLCSETTKFLPRNIFVPPQVSIETRDAIKPLLRLPNQLSYKGCSICRDHSLFTELFSASDQSRDGILRDKQTALVRHCAPLLHLLQEPQTKSVETCVKATIFNIIEQLRTLAIARLLPITRRFKLKLGDFEFSADTRYILSDRDTQLLRETAKRNKSFVSALSATAAPRSAVVATSTQQHSDKYHLRRQPTDDKDFILRTRDNVKVPKTFLKGYNKSKGRRNTLWDWKAPTSGPKTQGQPRQLPYKPRFDAYQQRQQTAAASTPQPPPPLTAPSQPQLPTPQY